MSSASSNQSVVHDGADNEEVFPSSNKEQESTSEDKSPSTSSSSSTNEDREMAVLEEDSDDGEDQQVGSVVGADGLKEFIILPEWTMHNFRSTIKENHFNTLRDNSKFQITFPSVYPMRQRSAIMKG